MGRMFELLFNKVAAVESFTGFICLKVISFSLKIDQGIYRDRWLHIEIDTKLNG